MRIFDCMFFLLLLLLQRLAKVTMATSCVMMTNGPFRFHVFPGHHNRRIAEASTVNPLNSTCMFPFDSFTLTLISTTRRDTTSYLYVNTLNYSPSYGGEGYTSISQDFLASLCRGWYIRQRFNIYL